MGRDFRGPFAFLDQACHLREVVRVPFFRAPLQRNLPVGANLPLTPASRTMKFLVAYDICCPKRLRRVARCLEKHAVRCQKSVFILSGSRRNLNDVMGQLEKLIRADDDLVQAWKLAPRETPRGTQRGTAPTLFPESVILGDRENRLIDEEGT